MLIYYIIKLIINNFIDMYKEKAEQKEQKTDPISPGRQKKQKGSLQRIQQTKANLDQVIQDLNGKLFDHFHRKQQELIQQYKQELIQAQKELNELKSTTSQQQIKNKMLQRKKQLQRERHELIQTNMFFSSKCEDYKKKLADLIAQGKELERELVFLDGQINLAHKKKYQVIQQSERFPPTTETINIPNKTEVTNTLPLFSDRKTKFDAPFTRKMANSVSVRDATKKITLQSSIQSKSKRNLGSNSQLDLRKSRKQLQKTALQQLFESTVEQIRQKRKIKRGIPSINGQEFSDYQKKMIMQTFLSREEVKKKIYQIIFESQDIKKPFQPNTFQPQTTKVKITFDDIN